ncbi:MAG: helix-turn-helix domain-containing protein [Acidiferrobacterales bacterium]|nr:helix-turn-helix domain-containing protein [Acidiferrobacterales bacterium]
MLFLNATNAQNQLRDQVVAKRLEQELTQKGLAQRSGVNLHTLRKFEQGGSISLKSFLKLLTILGGLDEVVAAVKPRAENFKSIDEVLESLEPRAMRKRGRRT